MTPLEQAKINYADARINFEIAEARLKEASQILINELNKPKEAIKGEPKLVEQKKEE